MQHAQFATGNPSPADAQVALGESLAVAQFLGSAVAQDFTSPDNMFCVTVYNEPLAAVQATLDSLWSAFQFAAQCRSATAALRHCVCLMIDGRAQADPELLEFLSRQRYIDTQARASSLPTPFCSLHSLKVCGSPHTSPMTCGESVRVIVCLKQHNRGKMDSHALFFGGLCAGLNPQLCYQIDAGTVIAADAVQLASAQFNRYPDLGALAPQVSTAQPTHANGFLQRWQYMDFSVQLATLWPAEVLSGHISVIPGQFCALRWQALINKQKRYHATSTGADSTPLSRYLRGVAPTSAMEKIMFLAEDRVIGNEIAMAADQRWRLDYCAQISATTDACTSLRELLRQRRRWNNCSFACRLWLVRQWPRYLARADRSRAEKLSFSASTFWQLLLSLQQVALPACAASISVLCWLALLTAVQGPTPAMARAAVLVNGVFFCLALWTPQYLSPTMGRLYAIARDSAAAVALLLFIAAIAQVLSFTAVLLLYLPMTALAVIPFVSLPSSTSLRALRHVPEYIQLNAPVQFVLWVYSLLHVADTSWGTKGLVQGTACLSSLTSMRKLRNVLVSSWVLLNVVVIWMATLPGNLLPALNPVAELVSLLCVVTACMGLVYCYGLQRVQRVPTGSPSRILLAAALRQVSAHALAGVQSVQCLNRIVASPSSLPARSQLRMRHPDYR